MELVNAGTCAKKIGVPIGVFFKYLKAGVVPQQPPIEGKKRPQYNPDEVLAALVTAGYQKMGGGVMAEPGAKPKKPRKKSAANDPREEQLEKFLKHLVTRADKRAAKAYRTYLLKAAQEAQSDPDIEGLELLILRHLSLVADAGRVQS